MKIEKIDALKGKYNIVIDGESIITYEDVILENGLLYKKEIDKNTYNNILKSTQFYDIYDKVVKLLLKSRKSEHQINDYLDKKNIPESDKMRIIEKLKSVKLIDDIAYAKAFINDKLLLNKWGINKIRLELINQDIDINVIENEISNVDESILNSNMEKIIIKKINSNHKYSNYQLKNKILQDMINLGYRKEFVLEIINKNMMDDTKFVKKEYDRLYKRLVKKYSGKELEFKIKQGLIKKGFDVKKIEE